MPVVETVSQSRKGHFLHSSFGHFARKIGDIADRFELGASQAALIARFRAIPQTEQMIRVVDPEIEIISIIGLL